ncbi:MAG: hypothetical protein U0359_41355, partial [Byssovorax sp.]
MGRFFPPLLPLLTAALVLAGCPNEAPPPRLPEVVKETPKPAPPPPEPPPAYVLADPDAQPKGTAIALDDGAIGLLVENARMSVKGGAIRAAPDLAGSSFSGVDRVPPYLGGGFLFRTRDALYRAEVFDGPLSPIVGIPSGISRLSFGPGGALVRSNGGQRWLVEIPSGKPLPIAPLGLLDLASLPDGRVAALTEGPRLSISTDKGEHYRDRTGELGGPPTGVSV